MTKTKHTNNLPVHEVVTVLVDDPVRDKVHHPYSAFNQGFEAKEMGYIKQRNPHPRGREHDWWNIGWDEANDQGLGPSEQSPPGGSGNHLSVVGSWRDNTVGVADDASQKKY